MVSVPLVKLTTLTPSPLLAFFGIITMETGSTPAPAPTVSFPSLPSMFSQAPKPTPILITGIKNWSPASIGFPTTFSILISLRNSSTLVLIFSAIF